MKGMNNICSINQKWVRESPDPLEQSVGTGEVKMNEVIKSTLSGSISGVTGHAVSKVIDNVVTKSMTKIEEKYSSNSVQKIIKKEIQTEMRQAGVPTKGKSAHQYINAATAKRIDVLKEAEISETGFTSKVADFTQQKLNSESADWIISGLYNQ